MIVPSHIVDVVLIHNKRVDVPQSYLEDKKVFSFNKNHSFRTLSTALATFVILSFIIWIIPVTGYISDEKAYNTNLAIWIEATLILITSIITIIILRLPSKHLYTLDLENHTVRMNQQTIPLSEITEVSLSKSGLGNGFGWILFIGNKDIKIMLNLNGLWEKFIATPQELSAWLDAIASTDLPLNTKDINLKKPTRYGLPLTKDKTEEILQSALFNEVNHSWEIR